MSGSHPELGLCGRRSEREALDRLLESVRAGQSRVLVLRGEPGVGKTALLDYLLEGASGCRVMRAAGVESEMELAFAGLHQFCAPMLNRRGHLPGPQREALETAFGLDAGGPPDRFLIGLAVLGLLAETAEERPLVCVIDDAQWLDRGSAQALAFVARRLLAEPVALVFAVREAGENQEDFAGLPELSVRGLSDGDARALLDWASHGRLDKQVRDRIVAETRGNPLALLELPRGLTPAELAGGFGLPDTMPLDSRIERGYMRRLESLPTDTQKLLLTAAAETVGDVTLLWRAAERLGIDARAAGSAETAGLIEFGARARFRHPLVRSAAYRMAAPADIREVHRALAEATDPGEDPDRQAWHRAHAAVGPDETVAGELERSADRAQGRGGVAAAAAFLARATELTRDPARRGTRALAAAQAKFGAGAPDAALELLATAELIPLDELQRARLEQLRARIAFAQRRGPDAPPLLLSAARRLEPLHAGLAREAYLEAFGAAFFVGRLSSGVGMRDVAVAARAAPRLPKPPRAIDVLLEGLATRFADGYVQGAEPLRRALRALSRGNGPRGDDVPWAWSAATDLWDDRAWRELASRGVGLAREDGTLSVLAMALSQLANVHVLGGEFATAAALIEEVDWITEVTGSAPLRYAPLVLAAWRGREAQASELVEANVREATARGEGRAIGLAGYATAVLCNGLGHYQAALAAAQRACEYEDLGYFGWALVELVEAGARTGSAEAAAAAMRRLEERTRAAGTDWARGIQACSAALLSDADVADALYREAIERLGRSSIAVHHARARLLYGEWLRRGNRRVDARGQLRRAHEMFTRMGAEAFAERARGELSATGATVHRRSLGGPEELTAQEAQIARLAADGHTNPEIGARLFISPRTAEWHLSRVFTKLGISSRNELRDALAHTTSAAVMA